MYTRETDTREVNNADGGTAIEVGSREWLLNTQLETFRNITDLTRRKNSDYAGKGGDAFNNFSRIEKISSKITTEQGFLVRLTDKLGRVGSLIDSGEYLVKDESVEDTLLDMSNYAFLFYAFLKAKKEKQHMENEANKLKSEIYQKAHEYDLMTQDNVKCAPECDVREASLDIKHTSAQSGRTYEEVMKTNARREYNLQKIKTELISKYPNFNQEYDYMKGLHPNADESAIVHLTELYCELVHKRSNI